MNRLSTVSPRAIGVIALVGASMFIAATMSGLIRKPFEPGGRTVYADFQRAPQVQNGDQVRIDGRVEGKVDEVKDLPGGGVRARMTVEDGAGPIFSDARAHVRIKTLLGGAFYVDLERGTSARGALGSAPIPVARTTVQVEIEDITDIIRGDAVRGLRTLPRELAAGLRDKNAPTRALDTLSHTAPDLRGGLEAIRGRQAGRDLPAVVANTEQTVRALDTPTDELRTLVAGAAATLETTSARSADLRATIRQAPAAAAGLTTTLARLRMTLDIAQGLVSKLHEPADDVAPTLAELHPAVVKTGHLVDRARPLLRELRPAVKSLASAATDGVPLVDGLRPSLKRTEDKIIPGLAKKDERTGKSTSVMIGGFAAGFGAIAGQQDQNGHLIRFPASGTSNSVHLACSSSLIDATAEALVACQTLQEALSTYMRYFPLTKTPGQEARR